jgi:hypothetical protein
VEIVATIDVNRDEMGAEMTIENWDEQVKIQCAAFFDDPIYLEPGIAERIVEWSTSGHRDHNSGRTFAETAERNIG